METIAQPQATLSGCDLVNNYAWDVQKAYAICMAESKGKNDAVGDDYIINGLHAPSCGLMQIRTLQGRPNCEQLKDTTTNLDWAWKISNGGTNWQPWSTYTSGKYLEYMPK